MNTNQKIGRFNLAAWLLVAAFAVAGCSRDGKKDDHASFATPDEAVTALATALEKNDAPELRNLMGPDSDALLSSGDAVADAANRAEFIAAYRAKHSLQEDGANRTLVVGEQDWPMPIPLVSHDGRWSFDGAAGADELVYRRVGANELGAIDVCRGFVAAQQEYAASGRDGDPAGIYALKLISDEGLHNGLYWPAGEGEPASPAGPFVAAAASEGYAGAEGRRTPYHGYYYRMLYKQGANANGGAREYFKDGLLTEGFALIAWPASYGVSGVQTFVVNQDGVVFQKDLGEDTAAAAEKIDAFDPDASWTAITPPTEAAAPAG